MKSNHVPSHQGNLWALPFLIIGMFLVENTQAQEEWEQKLIDADCHQFDKNVVDAEYLRCLKESIKAVGSGKEVFPHSGTTSHTVYVCGEDEEYRSCEIELINPKGYTVLSVSIERNLSQPLEISFHPSVTVNSNTLGDKCSCEVDEWAIETDNSKFNGWGWWESKEAVPVIYAILEANYLEVYSAIPSNNKQEYAESFSSAQIADFQKYISASINYLGM